MSEFDRDKWNARYQAGRNQDVEPSNFLASVAEALPRVGRALDVAGGAGRNGLWLAARGLDVTVADISEVGLAVAAERAAARDLPLVCREMDLELGSFPQGPWNVIVSCHFLQRELLPVFADRLAPDGRLVFVQATVTNLERHERPPRRFLLQRGELASLVKPIVSLEVLELTEGWTQDGFHQAQLLARKVEC